MGMENIGQFMAAIRRLESGSFGGDYSIEGRKITNPNSDYYGERAYGAYQIMPGNWAGWSAAAGLKGASINDPKAQDAVARNQFEKYYNELGDWDLVAIAWFSGMSRARAAKKRGVESLAGITDATEGSKGTSVPEYVAKIRTYMGVAKPSDSTEAMAQRMVSRPGEEGPHASYEEPEEEVPLAGAQQVGMSMVKQLSSLLRSGQIDGAQANDSWSRLMKLEG